MENSKEQTGRAQSEMYRKVNTHPELCVIEKFFKFPMVS